MAVVVDAFVDKCIEKFLNLAEEKVLVMLGVKDELKKLQRRMEKLSLYLEDAESKSFTDKPIRSWLGNLKDIVYDADDIIDLCKVEGTKLLGDHTPPTTTASVCCYCPSISCFTGIKFRHEIGKKIQKLNDRLEDIRKDDAILSRLESKKLIPSVHRVDYRQTSPLLESDIVGVDIEEATHGLVESLVQKKDGRTPSVFGIVGMGGIGKTTLARKVYNHASIADQFPFRVWLCVSQTFSETDLLKEVIRGVGGKCEESRSRAELEVILASALTKKLFLVLDDVWRPEVWEDFLRNPLEHGVASVQVLITTRYEVVAKAMRASIHNVEKMKSDDGLALLFKKVFGDCDDKEMLGLKDIGIEVVKRCDGLPLAIKAIAGVLRSKERTVKDWEKVLRSSAWSITELPEELRGSLYLSYEDLRSDLKQCFLFCSLYPEDYNIFRDELIQLWVAEGFIRDDGDTIMEDLAEEYYCELIGRSLLQPVTDQYCNMHDLLRFLAQFLIGEKNICLAGNTSRVNERTERKLRRLSFQKTSESESAIMPFDINKQCSLRTIMFFGSSRWQILLEKNIFNVLGCLRVLDLSNTSIKSLPDSVGTLVHLRLLDLSSAQIRELPESMGTLVNLQILNLLWCRNLNTLPNSITQLSSLRYLNVLGTSLSHMPKGLHQLKELNCLEGFLVGDDGICGIDGWTIGCNMEELENLSKLRQLTIYNLERAFSGTPVVKNKSFLKRVRWQFSQDSGRDNYVDTELRKMEKVLEELVPPQSLETLTIKNFPGSRYPSWMSPISLTSFNVLEYVDLSACISWTELPPLGQLPQLKTLIISGAYAIVTVGSEFLGGHTSKAEGAFLKLEKLTFRLMKNWEEWLLDGNELGSEGRGAASKLLPRLTELELNYCFKLRSLPTGLGHATCLKELCISYCESLIEVKNLPWLSKLTVNYCTSLQRISDLPLLADLHVGICYGLQRISDLPLLGNLNISNCPQLTHVANLDALRNLKLNTFSELFLPEWLAGLAEQELKIRMHDTPPTTSTSTSTAMLQPPPLHLYIFCHNPFLLRRCLKGGEDWHIIHKFPQVTINALHGESMMYTRTPPTYTANLYTGKKLEDMMADKASLQSSASEDDDINEEVIMEDDDINEEG